MLECSEEDDEVESFPCEPLCYFRRVGFDKSGLDAVDVSPFLCDEHVRRSDVDRSDVRPLLSERDGR